MVQLSQSNMPLEIPFVDLRAQYQEIEHEVSAAILGVIRESDFVLGQAVERFEQEFSAYCGVKHAVGVDSGMSALELALRAYGVGEGDEVITVANTFIASVLAISNVGAIPVLVDCDPNTYNIDVAAVSSAITPKTVAVLPVHLYGQPAEMGALAELATRHGLLLIEDACQAHGALYKGRRTGSLGHAAAFSFYPGKNLGAYGDGGMLTTNDAAVAEKVQVLRNYGQTRKYEHTMRGFNRRLDTLQAAVLSVKLKRLDSWNEARRRNARMYAELLHGSGLALPTTAEHVSHVWHLYVVRSRLRHELQQHLKSLGIQTGLHYPIPIHLQAAYKDLPYAEGEFPVSEALARECLSFPMYAELTPEMLSHVSSRVREFMDIHSGVAAGSAA